jgi:hypothetical protein
MIKRLATQQAAESQPNGYPEKLQEFLEDQLELEYRRFSHKREQEQKINLRTAFSIVNPITTTDLAFVVWCGDQYQPVADFASRYRDSKQTGKSWRDHYPFISLDLYNTPNSRGIFAFREELAFLLMELTDSTFSRAMTRLSPIYRASFKQIKRDKIDAIGLQGILKPTYRDRYTLEDIRRLHTFISDCYGMSRGYSMAAITAEHALNKLLSDKARPVYC